MKCERLLKILCTSKLELYFADGDCMKHSVMPLLHVNKESVQVLPECNIFCP